MCLEAYFCSAHFTECLFSFQTQTKEKEEKVGVAEEEITSRFFKRF